LTTGTVADAAAQARQAQDDVDTAERQLASGSRNIPFAALHKIRDRARHAALEREAARAKAERQHQAGHQAALAELAAAIDEAAGDAGPAGVAIAEALGDVAAAVARVRKLAADHDATVAELRATAAELGCRAAAPGGPREADALVAVASDGGVQHDRTVLRPVSPRVMAVVGHAVAGDVISAAALVGASQLVDRPKRADHHFRGRNGALIVWNGPLSEIQRNQIKNGDLTALTEAEIAAYQAGDLR